MDPDSCITQSADFPLIAFILCSKLEIETTKTQTVRVEQVSRPSPLETLAHPAKANARHPFAPSNVVGAGEPERLQSIGSKAFQIRMPNRSHPLRFSAFICGYELTSLLDVLKRKMLLKWQAPAILLPASPSTGCKAVLFRTAVPRSTCSSQFRTRIKQHLLKRVVPGTINNFYIKMWAKHLMVPKQHAQAISLPASPSTGCKAVLIRAAVRGSTCPSRFCARIKQHPLKRVVPLELWSATDAHLVGTGRSLRCIKMWAKHLMVPKQHAQAISLPASPSTGCKAVLIRAAVRGSTCPSRFCARIKQHLLKRVVLRTCIKMWSKHEVKASAMLLPNTMNNDTYHQRCIRLAGWLSSLISVQKLRMVRVLLLSDEKRMCKTSLAQQSAACRFRLRRSFVVSSSRLRVLLCRVRRKAAGTGSASIAVGSLRFRKQQNPSMCKTCLTQQSAACRFRLWRSFVISSSRLRFPSRRVRRKTLGTGRASIAVGSLRFQKHQNPWICLRVGEAQAPKSEGCAFTRRSSLDMASSGLCRLLLTAELRFMCFKLSFSFLPLFLCSSPQFVMHSAYLATQEKVPQVDFIARPLTGWKSGEAKACLRRPPASPALDAQVMVSRMVPLLRWQTTPCTLVPAHCLFKNSATIWKGMARPTAATAGSLGHCPTSVTPVSTLQQHDGLSMVWCDHAVLGWCPIEVYECLLSLHLLPVSQSALSPAVLSPAVSGSLEPVPLIAGASRRFKSSSLQMWGFASSQLPARLRIGSQRCLLEPCCDLAFLLGSAVRKPIHSAQSHPVRFGPMPTSLAVFTVNPPVKRPQTNGVLCLGGWEAFRTKSHRTWTLRLLQRSGLSALMASLRARSSPQRIAEQGRPQLSFPASEDCQALALTSGKMPLMHSLAARHFREVQLPSPSLMPTAKRTANPFRIAQWLNVEAWNGDSALFKSSVKLGSVELRPLPLTQSLHLVLRSQSALSRAVPALMCQALALTSGKMPLMHSLAARHFREVQLPSASLMPTAKRTANPLRIAQWLNVEVWNGDSDLFKSSLKLGSVELRPLPLTQSLHLVLRSQSALSQAVPAPICQAFALTSGKMPLMHSFAARHFCEVQLPSASMMPTAKRTANPFRIAQWLNVEAWNGDAALFKSSVKLGSVELRPLPLTQSLHLVLRSQSALSRAVPALVCQALALTSGKMPLMHSLAARHLREVQLPSPSLMPTAKRTANPFRIAQWLNVEVWNGDSDLFKSSLTVASHAELAPCAQKPVGFVSSSASTGMPGLRFDIRKDASDAQLCCTTLL